MANRLNGAVELGLRGGDSHLTTSLDNAIACAARVVEPIRSHLLVTGLILGQVARMVAPLVADVKPGLPIGLSVDPARLTWIDAATGKAMRQ
jgi:multiple sugar transport system ATP-binding protein